MRSLFLLTALLTTTACGDFLTIDPQDQLSRTELLGSLAGAEAALVGVYHGMGNEAYYRYRFPVYADVYGNLEPLSSGETIDPSDLNGDRRAYNRLHALQISPELLDTGMPNFYSQAYALLFQLNDLLDALGNLTEGPEAELGRLTAEARGLRAVIHFDLLRTFAQAPGFSPGGDHPGVVLLLEPPGILDEPARATVAEGYASVSEDLSFAAEQLAGLDNRSPAPIWLNATVAGGLRARVAAYAGDWSACAEWATRCLEDAAVELTPTGAYLEQWRMGAVSEMLWEIDVQRIVNERETPDPLTPARIAGEENPEPYLQVSDELLAHFVPGDLRRELIVSNREGDRVSQKWPRRLNVIRNPPLLRLSEVYLLRAEARAELGELAAAAADLAAVRERSWPAAPPVPLEQDALREEIRRERRRELALEGHHFFDLNRWGADLERSDCADFVTPCTLSYPHPRFVLPLPLRALQLNRNLRQNPGY